MSNSIVRLPPPTNEPVLGYAPGSPEKAELKARLAAMMGERIEIPAIIGGREVRTGRTAEAVCPHDHGHVLATVHQCGRDEVEQAVAAAREAWREWSETDWEARAAVFLKAADLLAGPWRATVNAATMLNQSKTAFQAEIDAACELADFWRFNAHYMERIYGEQPGSAPGVWNRVEYRALEGFVLAVTPFNFTSIAGNLPTAPALMGNVALWKPASTAVVSGYYLMRLLEAAGLPPGVVNFVPGRGGEVGGPAVGSRDLAGVHFTGSTAVFQGMWRQIGEAIAGYRSYPRIVGETGGKDFVFAHPSADAEALVVALVRGAFEYQGQKCSAASRAYVPSSLWPVVRDGLVDRVRSIRMGSPLDFRNFMAAVIDEASFDNTLAYVAHARDRPGFEILAGGAGDKTTGYFVEPTVIVSEDPRSKLMREEIFAPLLTVHVYEDSDLDAALELCDTGSDYGLTGAVFAQDRAAIEKMGRALRHAAGNFYVNDKPTGAVVGQQPFGGSRASGTNDKAGSPVNLLRWTSQRTIKETFVPPRTYEYPHMGEE
ncbi:MAG: L-glutamate gamma-semialdehyde dehydrogenase [Acidobacteriota bacterium]|nr:L-glutamate gamma-semialdehyde dehydrogenase [Acidobacteriota bacterium]MDH3525117.1 L-glutamate gamma-semialdehyde dehydrogenase [Acidobacteriota bacterium]